MSQDCRRRSNKSRTMSEQDKRKGPGRPRVVDRKPSEGRPELKLRLEANLMEWVRGKGGQEYLRRLVIEAQGNEKYSAWVTAQGGASVVVEDAYNAAHGLPKSNHAYCRDGGENCQHCGKFGRTIDRHCKECNAAAGSGTWPGQ